VIDCKKGMVQHCHLRAYRYSATEQLFSIENCLVAIYVADQTWFSLQIHNSTVSIDYWLVYGWGLHKFFVVFRVTYLHQVWVS